MNALAHVAVPTGYFCKTPVVFEWQGEAMSRPCGHCKRCFAVKKRDLTGRAAAEAIVSDEMITFTLTYKPGEPGAFKWCTADRQKFMKRIRAGLRYDAIKFLAVPDETRRATIKRVGEYAIQAAASSARYFGCGETGEKNTKRHHWHIVVFFKHGPAGRSGFESSPRDGRGNLIGKDHKIWPHGISTIDVHPHEMAFRMTAVRYVSKYISKAAMAFEQKKAGREPDALLFRSLKPALGAEYLGEWAEDHAKAGLPLPGEYTVPHVKFSRGRRESVRHRLLGVSRRHVIDRYRDAWVRLRPDVELPHSEFLARYDDLHVARLPRRPRPLGVLRSAPRPVVRPEPTHCAGNLVVRVGALVLGVVQTLRTGVAIWQPVGFRMVILDPPSLRGLLPGLDEDTHVTVEEFIRERRGPDWESPDDRWNASEDRRCARLQALVDGMPLGDTLELGTHSKRALTGVSRKLRIGAEKAFGQVDATGKPIRRPKREIANLEAYIDRDWKKGFVNEDAEEDERLARSPAPVWQRPPGETGLYWPDVAKTLRGIP